MFNCVLIFFFQFFPAKDFRVHSLPYYWAKTDIVWLPILILAIGSFNVVHKIFNILL